MKSKIFTPEEDQLILGCKRRGDLTQLATQLGYPRLVLVYRRRTLRLRADYADPPKTPTVSKPTARPDFFDQENLSSLLKSGR